MKKELGFEYIHFQHDLLAIYIDLFSIRVLDGRIVTLNPDILHELCSETAFADSSYCVIKVESAKCCLTTQEGRGSLPAPSTTM